MSKAYFNVPAIEAIFAECVATGIRKSHDYGSARDVIADNGVRGVVIRMDDKQARLLSLTSPGHEAAVKDESLADTFRDMINYAAYGLMLLQGTWGVRPPDPVVTTEPLPVDPDKVKKWGREFEALAHRGIPRSLADAVAAQEMLSRVPKGIRDQVLANHNRKVKDREDVRAARKAVRKKAARMADTVSVIDVHGIKPRMASAKKTSRSK